MLAECDQLRAQLGDRRGQAGAALALAHAVIELGAGRQLGALVLHQAFEQAGLQGQVLGGRGGLSRRHLVDVQGEQPGLRGEQAAGGLQGVAGGQGEVQGRQRLTIGLRFADREQHRHLATACHSLQGGAGEQLGTALVVRAHHRQVGAALLEATGDAFVGLAAVEEDLPARQTGQGQALAQVGGGRLAQVRVVEHVHQAQSGAVLEGQLGGAAQRHLGLLAEVMGDQDVTEHGEPPADGKAGWGRLTVCGRDGPAPLSWINSVAARLTGGAAGRGRGFRPPPRRRRRRAAAPRRSRPCRWLPPRSGCARSQRRRAAPRRGCRRWPGGESAG